jgi:hypothetical protein
MLAARRYVEMLDHRFDENEKLVAGADSAGRGSVCYLVLCESCRTYARPRFNSANRSAFSAAT